MKLFSKHLFAIFFIFNVLSGYAQVRTKNDSTMYTKIEDYSKKRKATKFLHKLIFRSTHRKPNNPRTQSEEIDLSEFQGKNIYKITIITHDPFGFSFRDSTDRANSWIEKTGNFIHIRTKPFAIRNFLLFKKGEPFDILNIAESERLLRTQNYIRSVEITVENSQVDSESVDIFVEVLDSWGLIPKIDLSTSRSTVKLKDRNFFGFGHEFKIKYTKRLDDGQNAHEFRYTVPNIQNSFVKTSIGYNKDVDGNYVKDFNIDRPFYSPLAKWAGGIYLDESSRKNFFFSQTLGIGFEAMTSQIQDGWLGHAFQIFEGKSEKERTTQLITAARLLHLDFLDSPDVAYDPINYFSNETFYMGSVGISSRQFIQDTYIFRDGIVEDVPIGTIFSATAGVQHKNNTNRLYLGARASHGNHFNWGYLTTNFEFGTFFRNNGLQQTAFSFQANYFTNLISLGDKWKLRQFVKPQFLIGSNRLNSIGDRLTIDENNQFPGVYGNDDQRENSAGIQSFRSGLTGTQKYVLSLQTQLYSPWEVLGFRLNPYLNFTSGLLGNEGTSILKSQLYTSFGIGFIIRNDYLVFSSFQLSLSYFPSIPGEGGNILKTNAFESDDFGLQNFQLGKPTPVWYN